VKILLIGASGILGRKVDWALSASDHQIVRIGRRSGDVLADFADPRGMGAMALGTRSNSGSGGYRRTGLQETHLGSAHGANLQGRGELALLGQGRAIGLDSQGAQTTSTGTRSWRSTARTGISSTGPGPHAAS
jgi:hypothetical protein